MEKVATIYLFFQPKNKLFIGCERHEKIKISQLKSPTPDPDAINPIYLPLGSSRRARAQSALFN